MNETFITVSGNVVGDPVVRATNANVPFVTFRVASNVRRLNIKTGEYTDAGTNFVNVTAFRALGVNLANSLKKGEPVIVYGRMRVNQWVNGDRSGTSVEIDANNVGHDLTRGQSTFTKVAKAQFAQNDRLADPEVQDANDQVDRDAAMAGAGYGEPAEAGEEPAMEEFGRGHAGGIELASADTDAYETVGARNG